MLNTDNQIYNPFNVLLYHLCSLHWLTIQDQTQGQLIFKALHGIVPQYLKALLIPYNPLASLQSASMNYLQEQRFTTRFGKRSFSAPKLWNKLPQEIRDIDTLAHFKNALKAHYCTKADLKRNASWAEV